MSAWTMARRMSAGREGAEDAEDELARDGETLRPDSEEESDEDAEGHAAEDAQVKWGAVPAREEPRAQGGIHMAAEALRVGQLRQGLPARAARNCRSVRG